MSKKLSPCSCGENELCEVSLFGKYRIVCPTCGANNGVFESKDEAIEKWNTSHDASEFVICSKVIDRCVRLYDCGCSKPHKKSAVCSDVCDRFKKHPPTCIPIQ